MMTLEQENEHLRSANLALQRRLERARRDALLYAAGLCEDHRSVVTDCGNLELVMTTEKSHAGMAYAAKLRAIAR